MSKIQELDKQITDLMEQFASLNTQLAELKRERKHQCNIERDARERERKRAYNKLYYEKMKNDPNYRELRSKQTEEYRKRNPDCSLEWRRKHPDYQREWRARHPEYWKGYYSKTKERLKEQANASSDAGLSHG